MIFGKANWFWSSEAHSSREKLISIVCYTCLINIFKKTETCHTFSHIWSCYSTVLGPYVSFWPCVYTYMCVYLTVWVCVFVCIQRDREIEIVPSLHWINNFLTTSLGLILCQRGRKVLWKTPKPKLKQGFLLKCCRWCFVKVHWCLESHVNYGKGRPVLENSCY